MRTPREKEAPTNAIARAIARGYTPACFSELHRIITAPDTSFGDRMTAIQFLLRVGHGRAMLEGVEQDGPETVLTPAQKIDALWQSQFLRALAGDTQAIEACLRIIERQQPGMPEEGSAADVQAIRVAALKKARAFFAREGTAGATEQ